MTKRMLWMLAAVAVCLAVLAYFKYSQIQSAIAQAQAFRPPPEAVTTVVAREESWETTVGAIGTVEAVQGVTVSADSAGRVERIAFDSGERAAKGELLVGLDTRQERAQLAAAEADLSLARTNHQRMSGLREKGVVSQAELDRADAELKRGEAVLADTAAAIDRKTIRAPFTGVLGIRQVNIGQYLSPGDPVVELQVLQPVYVDFTVPQQELARLEAGTEVRVAIEGGSGEPAVGRVSAVDAIVDEATRNMRVRASLPNDDGRLRPGMFVEVTIVAGGGRPVVALPASAISYAPYGDSVFVVTQLTGPDGSSYLGVRQQVVELGQTRGDQVAVLRGIAPGDEVVTSGVFKLRNGVAVEVRNDVQPTNDPAPHPENS